MVILFKFSMQVLAYFVWVVVPVTNLIFRAIVVLFRSASCISFHSGFLSSLMVLLKGCKMSYFSSLSCVVFQAHGTGEHFLGPVPVVAGSPLLVFLAIQCVWAGRDSEALQEGEHFPGQGQLWQNSVPCQLYLWVGKESFRHGFISSWFLRFFFCVLFQWYYRSA